MEKLCQTCGISLNLGSSPCPTPVRRNIESFFCSNIYILCLLTCLLASLPDEGEEFFKINFSVPISVYLAKQPSHLHMCTKNCNKIQSKMNNLDQCPTQFDQRYKVLICASIFWFQAVISQWVSESYFLDALASCDFKFSVREWVRAASDVSDARIMTPDQPSTPSPASQLPAWLSSWTGREGGKSQRCTDVRNINHLLKLVECEVSRISLLKNDKRLQRRLLNRRINAGLKNVFWL